MPHTKADADVTTEITCGDEQSVLEAWLVLVNAFEPGARGRPYHTPWQSADPEPPAVSSETSTMIEKRKEGRQHV